MVPGYTEGTYLETQGHIEDLLIGIRYSGTQMVHYDGTRGHVKKVLGVPVYIKVIYLSSQALSKNGFKGQYTQRECI